MAHSDFSLMMQCFDIAEKLLYLYFFILFRPFSRSFLIKNGQFLVIHYHHRKFQRKIIFQKRKMIKKKVNEINEINVQNKTIDMHK